MAAQNVVLDASKQRGLTIRYKGDIYSQSDFELHGLTDRGTELMPVYLGKTKAQAEMTLRELFNINIAPRRRSGK